MDLDVVLNFGDGGGWRFDGYERDRAELGPRGALALAWATVASPLEVAQAAASPWAVQLR